MIDDEYPTLEIRDAVNELLRRNRRTKGAEVAEMYLSSDLFVARLRRTRVIEGQFVTVDKTTDLFDLIDEHQRGL